MWLHRNKGGITTEGSQSVIVGDFNYSSGSQSTFDVGDTNWEFNIVGEEREEYEFSLAIDVKTGYTDVKYSVKAYDSVSDTILAEFRDVTDDQTLTWYIRPVEAIPVTD